MGRCKMNKHKQPGPTLLCERIGQELFAETGVWFGSMDVMNCLARGLRGGGRLATGSPASGMFALSRASGLKVTPGHLLSNVVAMLNQWAENDRVTEAILQAALTEVMRLSYQVIVVTMSAEGELSFETAQSIAELMKQRAVTRMRVQARQVGVAVERRAA